MVRLLRRTGRFALWGSAGALVAYLFDPQNGRGRRNKMKDQLLAKVRRTGDQIDKKGRYLDGKLEGAAHTVTSPGGTPPADDKALSDKIRSEILGGPDFAGHQVLVDAADGVVALRGELQRPDQIKELESAVRKVPGVRDVENLVHLPGTPAPNKQDSLGV